MALSMSHSPFRVLPTVLWTNPQPQMLWGLPVLVWNFFFGHSPCTDPLQRYTCCIVDLSTATVTCRCICSSVAFFFGHSPCRDPFRHLLCHVLIHRHRCFKVFLKAWPYPWTQTLKDVSAAARTSLWPQMIWDVLYSRVDKSVTRDTSVCTCSHMDLSTGHSPSDSI